VSQLGRKLATGIVNAGDEAAADPKITFLIVRRPLPSLL